MSYATNLPYGLLSLLRIPYRDHLPSPRVGKDRETWHLGCERIEPCPVRFRKICFLHAAGLRGRYPPHLEDVQAVQPDRVELQAHIRPVTREQEQPGSSDLSPDLPDSPGPRQNDSKTGRTPSPLAAPRLTYSAVSTAWPLPAAFGHSRQELAPVGGTGNPSRRITNHQGSRQYRRKPLFYNRLGPIRTDMSTS